MYLKHLRVILQKTIITLLATVVMAGALGLSFQAHYCHDKLSGIALYPGLGLQQSASCGCADEDFDLGSQIPQNNPVLSKKSCCTNISYFKKLIIELPVKDFTPLVVVRPLATALFIDITYYVNPDQEIYSFADKSLMPLPLAGRELVLFLSQQRIPLVSYNC